MHLFYRKPKHFIAASGTVVSTRGKTIEVVLLACHSYLSCCGNFHIGSSAWKSIKLDGVRISRSSCTGKRDNTLGYRWGNLLVWEKKGKEALIPQLLGFILERFCSHKANKKRQSSD